nr:MAG TPA: hypothetical protein [Caudoviricetes sp.]DAR53897.1 MAG TPA: hypothetical protein [Bacteriophage sp.]
MQLITLYHACRLLSIAQCNFFVFSYCTALFFVLRLLRGANY